MRAILLIIKQSQILLIHRFYYGKEYYVFPGGGVEEGETPELAALRELGEETSLAPNSIHFLFQHKDESDSRTQYVYLINDFTGIPILGGPEKEQENKDNQYILEWHDIREIPGLTLRPISIQSKIIENLSLIEMS